MDGSSVNGNGGFGVSVETPRDSCCGSAGVGTSTSAEFAAACEGSKIAGGFDSHCTILTDSQIVLDHAAARAVFREYPALAQKFAKLRDCLVYKPNFRRVDTNHECHRLADRLAYFGASGRYRNM